MMIRGAIRNSSAHVRSVAAGHDRRDSWTISGATHLGSRRRRRLSAVYDRAHYPQLELQRIAAPSPRRYFIPTSIVLTHAASRPNESIRRNGGAALSDSQTIDPRINWRAAQPSTLRRPPCRSRQRPDARSLLGWFRGPRPPIPAKSSIAFTAAPRGTHAASWPPCPALPDDEASPCESVKVLQRPHGASRALRRERRARQARDRSHCAAPSTT